MQNVLLRAKVISHGTCCGSYASMCLGWHGEWLYALIALSYGTLFACEFYE